MPKFSTAKPFLHDTLRIQRGFTAGTDAERAQRKLQRRGAARKRDGVGASAMLRNEPLARHTSWRVGGPADRYYKPADVDDLVAFLGTLPEDEPLLWIGLLVLLIRPGLWVVDQILAR